MLLANTIQTKVDILKRTVLIWRAIAWLCLETTSLLLLSSHCSSWKLYCCTAVERLLLYHCALLIKTFLDTNHQNTTRTKHFWAFNAVFSQLTICRSFCVKASAKGKGIEWKWNNKGFIEGKGMRDKWNANYKAEKHILTTLFTDETISLTVQLYRIWYVV